VLRNRLPSREARYLTATARLSLKRGKMTERRLKCDVCTTSFIVASIPRLPETLTEKAVCSWWRYNVAVGVLSVFRLSRERLTSPHANTGCAHAHKPLREMGMRALCVDRKIPIPLGSKVLMSFQAAQGGCTYTGVSGTR
jgi:hypothetical protein